MIINSTIPTCCVISFTACSCSDLPAPPPRPKPTGAQPTAQPGLVNSGDPALSLSRAGCVGMFDPTVYDKRVLVHSTTNHFIWRPYQLDLFR